MLKFGAGMNAIKLIAQHEVVSLIKLDELITVVEDAYKAQAEGRTSPTQYINMKVGSNMVHFKAGFIRSSKYFTVKYSGGFWGNENTNFPVDPGYVIAHDADTGLPKLMFLDDGAITNYRTAASGAVAIKYLANEESRVVGIIGNGIQARLQIEAALLVRPGIERVQAWGRNPQRLDAYINEMRSRFSHIEFLSCSEPRTAIHGADIVITATASTAPIVKPEWLSPGSQIVAVGACAPDMQEHDPLVFKKVAKIYADSVERCLQDGEIHHALEAGVIGRNDITGELGSLIIGQTPTRANKNETIFVDLVGLGILDAAVVEYLSSKL